MAVISNGTTLIDNGTLDAAIPTGDMTLISTQTASASATISFTSGIDATYDSYVFKFYDIHPATDNQDFGFQGSTNGGSSYGVTITSSHFSAYHDEADSSTSLGYDGSGNRDLAQSTNLQSLSSGTGNGNDECYSGTLTIYQPSSATFVKHFIARGNHYNAGDYSINNHMAGYFNTTSAIDAIQFKFASGNTDSGTIKLYGIGG